MRFRSIHWLLAGVVAAVFLYGGLVAYLMGLYPASHVLGWAALWLLGSFVTALLVGLIAIAGPERRARSRRKKCCLESYRYRKRLLIRAIVSGSIRGGRNDLNTSPEAIERLMSVIEFRKTFGEGRQADQGFEAYRSYIDKSEIEFRLVTFQLSLIARRLDDVVDACDTPELFELMKDMEEVVFLARLAHPDHEAGKRVSALLYRLFSGLSLASGYRDEDQIEAAIGSRQS